MKTPNPEARRHRNLPQPSTPFRPLSMTTRGKHLHHGRCHTIRQRVAGQWEGDLRKELGMQIGRWLLILHLTVSGKTTFVTVHYESRTPA